VGDIGRANFGKYNYNEHYAAFDPKAIWRSSDWRSSGIYVYWNGPKASNRLPVCAGLSNNYPLRTRGIAVYIRPGICFYFFFLTAAAASFIITVLALVLKKSIHRDVAKPASLKSPSL
jgi:hypothetical protein